MNNIFEGPWTLGPMHSEVVIPRSEIFQVLEMYNMLLEISSELDSIKAMLEKSELYIFHQQLFPYAVKNHICIGSCVCGWFLWFTNYTQYNIIFYTGCFNLPKTKLPSSKSSLLTKFNGTGPSCLAVFVLVLKLVGPPSQIPRPSCVVGEPD